MYRCYKGLHVWGQVKGPSTQSLSTQHLRDTSFCTGFRESI